MTEFRTEKDALARCQQNGQIIPIAEIDTEQISSMVKLARGDQEAGEKLAKGLEPKSILWNNVYTSWYDSLHKLIEAFLRMEKVTSLNHLCLFAYLVTKHPELELDWKFFEEIRTKRNGIHYYGQKADSQDWKGIEVQMRLYCRILLKAVVERLEKMEEGK